MRHFFARGLLVLSLLANQAFANPVVYQQPPVALPNSYASQNDPGIFGDFAKVYDSFRLAAKTSITDVHWTGQYFNPATKGTITSFLIQIWSDAGGPGGSLMAESHVGTANETHVSGVIYDYGVDFATAFVAEADTTYWLSIQPTMLFPPQWGWEAGTGGDGIAFQDFSGVRSTVPNDMAFSLTGATVEEPVSLALVGMALVGLFALGRRKSA